MIDALEPRRMLAVFSGTTDNDTINIFASGTTTHIVVNGLDETTSDLAITVGAGFGNDTITVQSMRSSSSILVLGQNDNDTLVNPTLLDLDAVYAGNFEFDGGNGIDTLVADNGGDSTTSSTIDIHLGTIAKTPTRVLLSYRNIETLDYWDSNGGNRIGFISMQGQQDVPNLRIHGNGGNDLITNTHSVAPDDGDWFTSVGTGGVFVDGGSGTDTLRLRHTVGSGLTHTINASTINVTVPGLTAGPLTYSGCETIDWLTGASGGIGDTIVLNGKPSGTTLNFDAAGGDDTFVVGGGDINSNGLVLANTTLVGGAGTDSITFNDALDTSADGTTSAYAWDSATLAKGSTGFNYSGFESQTLNAANGVVAGFNSVPVINLNSTASSIQSTTINGGASRAASVNIGTNNFSSLFGTFAVQLNGGSLDRITINDQNAAGPANGYQVTDTLVRRFSPDRTINYSGVAQMTLNTSEFFDVVNVGTTAAGMSLTVNTNGGDDIVNVGGGNVDVNLRGPVTVNGGPGANVANVSNSDDTTLENQTLNGATFIDGFAHTFNSVDQLNIAGGPGGTNMAINSTAHKTNVGGGSGPDTFTVGGGDIDANFPSGAAQGLFIDGAGGNDSILLNDLNDTGVDTYNFQRPNGTDQLIKDAVGVPYYVSWAGIEGVTLDASNAPTSGTSQSPIIVFDIATPLRINGNDGSDWVLVLDSAVPVFVNTGTGTNDQINVNHDNDGVPVTVVVDQNDEVEALNVFAAGTLRVTNGATLVKTRATTAPGTLSIAGALDLAGGSFLSRAGGPTQTQFRTQIAAGYNGGSWNGTADAGTINSSLAAGSPISDAVGYGLGSEIGLTSIGGFNIAPGDTLLRYTLAGDANLNGGVDLTDFTFLAAHFNQPGQTWLHGDSNYDSNVDLTDFTFLASNFNQTVPGPLPLDAATASPFGQQRVDADPVTVVDEWTA